MAYSFLLYLRRRALLAVELYPLLRRRSLEYIYSSLKAGKPVIIHCSTYSGSSHWIVVYGFTGGSALTASAFLINDPATIYRTNLAQYFAVYPVWQKAVTYLY